MARGPGPVGEGALAVADQNAEETLVVFALDDDDAQPGWRLQRRGLSLPGASGGPGAARAGRLGAAHAPRAPGASPQFAAPRHALTVPAWQSGESGPAAGRARDPHSRGRRL
jgi:hypothetical protein